MSSNSSTPEKPTFARLQRLRPYFEKPRLAWLIAILSTIVLSMTEPLIPALMQPLLDTGFRKGDLQLWTVPAALISIFGIRGLSNFIAQMALAKVAHLGLLRMRKAMFARLLDAEMGVFKHNSSSALSNTVVYEVQAGSVLLVQALMTLVRDSLTLLALIGYLMFLNWKLTLIVALLFPAVALVMRSLTKRLYRITKSAQNATDQLAYVVEENVLAHRDIRLHAAQDAQIQRFGTLGTSLNRLFLKSTAASAAMTPLTQMLAAVALSTVICVALVQSTDNATTVGSFAAFVTAMLMLVAPIKHLSEVASPITRGLAAIERGLDLIDNTPTQASGSHTKPRALGEIHFDHVSVTYDEGKRAALDDFCLSVKPGETVALVGASGSGKTTLVNLLPRFIESTSGHIFLDGVALPDWDLLSLRDQFAQVSQHVFMLNDTIAVNVALGHTVDAEKVHRCLAAANLSEFIAQSPLGIETVVGHNAMQLSGGQRQRLAIARALYKDAPILILDEATSALDAESEKSVQDALQRLMAGRTTLVIAHRLSTVQHANRIVVMSNGKILEVGSHQDLLALNQHYARLYRLGLNDSTPTT